MRRRIGAVLAPALVLLGASDAAAFCRTVTCQLDVKAPCPQNLITGCFTSGAPVYWGDNCLSYAIQRDGSLAQGITAEQVAPIVEAGFRAWSDVTCPNGGTPPLTALSQGLTSCADVEYNCKEPEANSNVILFHDDFDDSEAFHFGTIALTTLTANKTTGQIFDADIEINSRDEMFALGTPADGNARDLRGVINHELGHLLGLSHPNVSSALMYANYKGTLLPAADDAAGICEIRSGASSDPECTVTELSADAGCIGKDTSCKAQQQLVQEQKSGCECELGAVPRRSPDALSALGGLGVLLAASRRRR